jgi:predicted RNA-binding protein YlqC (UPF0109 family)
MPSTIDQQFVEFVVKSLVTNPEDVKIERIVDEKGVLLTLTVNPEDLGRVIGKHGATAQSIRTLLRSLGKKNDARYNLKIVDTDKPESERRESAPTPKDEQESQQDSTPAEDNSTATVETITEEVVEEEPQESDLASKTRKELADLDDLDI